MAIILAGIGVQAAGLTFAGGGFFAALAGGALTAGAGMLDSAFLIPGLLGAANKPLGARPPLLMQLPTFTSNPGSPRVWSYGQRVRIPCHLMFMSEKERIERTQSGAAKGGTQARTNVRKVYSDVAIALNDKNTNQIATLLGDGRLFYWTDRNLLSIRTSAMTTTVRNTNFVMLQMGNANEIDLSNRFSGRVRYEGVVATATNNGPSYSSGGEATMTVSPSPGWTTNQWVNKVFVVTSGPREGQRGYVESNTADTVVVQYRRVLAAAATIEAGLTVQPQVNDTFVIAEAGDTLILAGWNPAACNGFYRILYARPHRLVGTSEALLELVSPGATATAGTSGSPFTPGSVTRFDNGVAGQRLYSYENRNATEVFITREDASASDFAPKIVTGMNITMRSSRFTGGSATGRVDRVGPGQIKVVAISSLPSPTPSATINIFDNLIVEPSAGTNSVPGLYTDVRYYDGTQTTSSGIIAQHLSAADIPQYRGVSYIIFDDFSLTEFGNRIPNMEAVIDPDIYGTWRDAFANVCDRVGLPASQRALGQVDTAPFDGIYIRGTIPGTSALQPLLVAKQVVTQDRDGVLHFFPISACEVVQIRNGTDYSDMGAATERDAKRPKFSMAQVERTVLPSSVGVRHQDPDNFYSEGYQHFGIRGPSGAGHETRDEVDLSNLVLNRQAARNLAGTLLRRTWINSTSYELELPASYWHVLENDVLTWTDDESIVHAARVIKIDRGQNWIVKATCVAEDVANAYQGSPVQSGAGFEFDLDGPSVDVKPLILDIPAVFDIETRAPGLYLGVGGPANTEFLGCTIYESLDSGTTYNPIASVTQQTTSGTTLDALDTYTSQSWTAGSASVTWDNTSTVQVELFNGTLSTVTQAQVLGGENWALIGNEIVGFTTATLDSPGTYTLSGFLRNLRDQVAEPDIDADQHVVGERFVLLTRFEANGKFRTYPGPANVGQALRFKFVAAGQNIVDVAHVAVTLQAKNAKPFAPYASTLTWESNDDATITMTPWTNRNVAIGSTGPYTFDDTVEEYVVRIYTNNTYTMETVSSPLTVTTRATGAARLRDRWVTYPKADVLADGFTPGSSTIYYSIEQVGDYGASRRKRFQG